MIFYHADDYGINIKQSRRILNCYYQGVLNSISVICNSDESEESVKLLPEDIEIAVHLNFLEGKCLSDKNGLGLLVDECGYFKLNYWQLLIKSFLYRSEIKKEIALESSAQIKKLVNCKKTECNIGIDSHRHYHAIPAVFEGVLLGIREVGIIPNYIRMPYEPIYPFISKLRTPGVGGLIKNIFLRLCCLIDEGKAKKYNIKTNYRYVMGVALSGRMFYENVLCYLDKFRKTAEKRGRDLELIFHPGGLQDDEYFLSNQYKNFYLDTNRKIEYNALMQLNTYVRK